MIIDNLEIRIAHSGNAAAKSVGNLSKSLSKLNDPSKKANKGLSQLVSSLKRIAMYRILRTVLKEIGQAVEEGLQHVYIFSQTINSTLAQTLDALASLGGQVKNQFGAAFGELLTTIRPALETLLNLALRVADAFSQLFAILGGRGVYHKAIGTTEKFAKTTASGAKAAKEWKNQLLGFDEINRLEAPAEGGGGGGSNPYEDMGQWELAEVSDAFQHILNWMSELKRVTVEWWNSLDFSRLIASWEQLKTSIAGLVSVIDRGLYWAYTNVLLPLAGWTITKLTPVIITLLSSALNLLKSAIEKLSPLAKTLWDDFLKPLADWTGEKVLQALQWLADRLQSIADKVEKANSLSEFIQSLDGKERIVVSIAAAVAILAVAMAALKIASTVFKTISDAIGLITSPLGIAIGAITAFVLWGMWMISNWDVFGVDLTNIYEGMKEAASGWCQFLVGLAEGDWKTAWEGLSSVVDGNAKLIDGSVGAITKSIGGLIDWVQKKFAKLFDDGYENTDTWLEKIGRFLNEKLELTQLKLTLWSYKIQGIINGLATAVKGVATGDWALAWSGLQDAAESASLNVSAMAQNILDSGGNAASAMSQTAANVVNSTGDMAVGVGKNSNSVSDALTAIGMSKLTAHTDGTSLWFDGVIGRFGGSVTHIASSGNVHGGSGGSFGIPSGTPGKFASGGFPEDGFFFANHNELVGQFSNGRTAVANNDQIVAGIQQGVYEAVSAAMSERGGMENIVKVYLDSREIKNGQQRLNRATGW